MINLFSEILNALVLSNINISNTKTIIDKNNPNVNETKQTKSSLKFITTSLLSGKFCSSFDLDLFKQFSNVSKKFQ
jgi:hypothetical protein